MFLKNITGGASAHHIYVGLVQDGDTAAIAANGSGTNRSFTLNDGEFAFFPYDYTGDIIIEGSAASQKLEMWRFDRHTS